MTHARAVDQIGYSDLRGNAGFKLAMQEVEGRFFLYVTGMWKPGLSILEVTDPTRPRYVAWVAGPAATWTLQVQVADGHMVTSLEHVPQGQGWVDESTAARHTPREGVVVWDVADPEHPRTLGKWRGGATGTHRNFYAGGRYIHAAGTADGYIGRIYRILDIDDPTAPREVGRWWIPGQHKAAGEQFEDHVEARRHTGRPFPNEAISLHGGPYVVGDRVYCPWGRGGLVILDIADVAAPRHVATLPVYPPLGSSLGVHTAIPLPDRKLVLINDEALHERRREPANYAAAVDISDEQDPILISLFPAPQAPDGTPGFFLRGGRHGPHNQHQPQDHPALAPVDRYVYMTYFNAGLQVFDIAEPLFPRPCGYYIPADPEQRLGPLPETLATQAEDVLVDRRGVIYMTEKNSGLYILRHDPSRGD